MQAPVAGEFPVVEAPTGANYFWEDRKRFRSDYSALPPSVVLGADGMIKQVTPAACRLLRYRQDQDIKPSFFSHVHGKNLYQVMRDVADMVCYGKSAASWLLRLRTGQGDWRWFKATVKSAMNGDDGAIYIHLHDLSDL